MISTQDLVSSISAESPGVFQARLTLTSGLPVTTADVTAAGTIYLTPFRGNTISLYNGSTWDHVALTQISLALTATDAKPYDVWVYNNGGTPTLETTVWTDDTTRATALAYQDGVLSKTGTLTRRYVGSFYASGTNMTEDSKHKRYLWNYYNRVPRQMQYLEATNTWGFSNAAADPWRQVLGSTDRQLNFILGVAEDMVQANSLVGLASDTDGDIYNSGIGLDSTTVCSTDCIHSQYSPGASALSEEHWLVANYRGYPTAGRHRLVWMEGGPDDNVTWYGDIGTPLTVQSGIHGTVWA